MAQQTAVEYLFEQLWETPKDKFTWHSILKKAKEMEEQRMFEFWNGGIDCTEEGGKSFEQYYNETFKNE
jgi:hypothetical protein